MIASRSVELFLQRASLRHDADVWSVSLGKIVEEILQKEGAGGRVRCSRKQDRKADSSTNT